MLIIYPVLLLIAAISFGAMMVSRNSYRHTANHWDYIASRLRLELYAAQDELDKYGPTDAGTPLAERIRSLATSRQQAVTMLQQQRQAAK